MALGAGRTRIMRQMLTEALALSFISGAAGVLAAKLTLSFIIRFVSGSVPRLAEVGVDRTVLLFALLISIFTGIIFGLAPTFQAMIADKFRFVAKRPPLQDPSGSIPQESIARDSFKKDLSIPS
jgi:ABC-type antimicrobial peptide transport system permease subunit